MALIEKLGSFYLGKEYDLAGRQLLDRPVHYDSRDLTTHAVCVGMTGSGKTGLCIDLLEEAALDGVPAIIIDPKGDITNLLLTFPDLLPQDFLPWINADDARRKGLSPEEYAAQTATSWREGLATWDQGPERIRQLKEAADFAIYTPGSEAGLPVSILSSFTAPKLDWDVEPELLRDRVLGTVSALLGLVGIQADPVRSREHILLSTIFEHAWRAGEDLDLAKVILAVQNPPFRQLGVFDLDTFFPEKDRFSLALMLNNIVASPSFAAWLHGEPLDIAQLLYTPAGKPKHSVFYIAHLNDAERMFFVTILLEQVIGWMRSQPGTTSLRALLYMDEVFGFFPPVAEPPSKRPMMTLLKQARAFGLGVVLTTQNPVDVDYKGLTNAGTWFIGKLQAERDKERLMAGLESAMAEAGTLTDPRVLDKLISSLESRVFLLHSVHADGPVVFNTRWAMSYLRGPLTRQQIKQLMADRVASAAGTPAAAPVQAVAASRPKVQESPAPPTGLSSQPPVVAPGLKPVYLPVTVTAGEAAGILRERTASQAKVAPDSQRLVYEPAALGMASVRFADRKLEVDETRDFSLLLVDPGRGEASVWSEATAVAVAPRDLEDAPVPDALFAHELPAGLSDTKALKGLADGLEDYLYRTEGFSLAYNPALKLYAAPGESDWDFRLRCQQAAREARDAAVDKLRDKYEVKIDRLADRLERAERDLAEDKAEYDARKREEVVSGVETVVGFLGIFGRRRSSRALSTASTKRRMTSRAKSDIAEGESDVARLQAEQEELKAQMEEEASALTQEWSAVVDDVQKMRITPRKADVKVQMVTLAWAPVWEITYEDERGRARTESIPAHAEGTSDE